MDRSKKTFKVYQKDKDKGKGKVCGIPNIKITNNLPPPLDTTLIHSVDPPVTDSIGVTHDDTNLDSKILFTTNVDTQEVNIVVDKDNTKVKNDIANNGNIDEQPVENVEVETQTEHTLQIEQLLDTSMNTEGTKTGTEKATEIELPTGENIEKPIEKPTEKPTKVQVHIEAEKPVITEKPKPLQVETQTQTDPPEDNTRKLVTNVGSTEVIKGVGQTSYYHYLKNGFSFPIIG